jgi:hypothetical protein
LKDKDTPSQSEQELNFIKERLTRCLQLLKINHDDQISKTAFKLIENGHARKTQHGNWIIALNSIAGSCLLNQRDFSQSEIYDFLTVAVTTSLEGRTRAIDELIFRIYRDIMATYEGLHDKLKIAYPKIIVDVVSIIAEGVDTKGKKIPIHNIEVYYHTRKSDVISSTPITTLQIPVTTATAASIQSIDEEPELLDILNKIIDRSKKDIHTSIAKLERRDVLRIKDLCKNYNKLQKYSKLITDTDDLQKFKTALQSEIGKRLSDHQVQHAASSIRKAKMYIENVLDGKFSPRGAYGINHTKHNLEYGYLIVGLMQSGRKKLLQQQGERHEGN